MKRNVMSIIALVFTVLFYSFANNSGEANPANQPSQVKEHKLSIQKVKNKWKVVDEMDTTKTMVKAKRGERIVWIAKGSDVYFQFMDQKLFGDYTRSLKNGQRLVLTIGSQAKGGPNRYAVFCMADKAFATGESPPVIIIE